MCGKVSGPTGNVPVVAVSEVARLPGVSVWAVDCCAVHPGWSDVEVRDDHRFVLVRGGRFVRRIGRRESMADTTVAYLGVPGEVEQFAHPAGGDRCTSISVRPELWRAIAGDDWTLGRSDVYVDARVDLLHRRLLRAGRTGDVHFALAEEVVRLVAVAALAASRARSCSHRRGGIPDHAVAAAARAAVLDDEPGSDGLIPLAERFGCHRSRSVVRSVQSWASRSPGTATGFASGGRSSGSRTATVTSPASQLAWDSRIRRT